jgi:transcriptional regulator GlxA family with amidase domain
MKSTKIVFLVLPHVHLLDLAGAMQVFYEAIDYGAALSLEYCSLDGGGVQTTALLPIASLKRFSAVDLRSGDYIIVPGSDVSYLLSSKVKSEKEAFQWIQRHHATGVTICSICTGAFFLAQAGLLDGRKCTTHWKRTAQLKEKYPSINLQENILFTEDDNIYTSAGVTAGIDLALHLLKRIKDDHTSFKVARELVVYARRHGEDPQQSFFLSYRNHIHAGIHKVQDYLQENVTTKTSLDQLSEIACMSTRTLTRIFKRETGVTVNEYLNLVRREKLKELVKNPDMSRRQMARHCGLRSERQVIRLLRQSLAVSLALTGSVMVALQQVTFTGLMSLIW